MRHGVEVRAPYLDHELLEFAFRLPVRYRVRFIGRRRAVSGE